MSLKFPKSLVQSSCLGKGQGVSDAVTSQRVRTAIIKGETHWLPERRGLSAGPVSSSVRSPARGRPFLAWAPSSLAPFTVLSAPPHLGPNSSECVCVYRLDVLPMDAPQGGPADDGSGAP